MKKMALVAVAGLLLVAWCGIDRAEARPRKRYDPRTKMCRQLDRGKLDWNSEPWGIGGKKFREVCKRCHTRNNDKGAPFLWTESYTSKAWNSIFARRRAKCARDGSWDVLSEEELQMVNDYLYRNGDWTYDPNDADSCG
ncbi:MAG TPA: hypothetical protein ENK27_04130 [Desulfobulbus sp.]|nr:hypothetical protein [Desulfobulbus sp.]